MSQDRFTLFEKVTMGKLMEAISERAWTISLYI